VNRTRWIVALLVVLGVVIAFLMLRSPPAVDPAVEAPAGPRKAPPPPAVSHPAEITVLPIATDIAPLNSPEATAEDDLATLEILLAEFARNHGGHPVGENDEITASLLGKNPKRVAYLPAEGAHLNASGQLIDRWSTPYFFHQLSSSQTEIRSAGPDREMHTPDDVIR
jgi:hypothetical protein